MRFSLCSDAAGQFLSFSILKTSTTFPLYPVDLCTVRNEHEYLTVFQKLYIFTSKCSWWIKAFFISWNKFPHSAGCEKTHCACGPHNLLLNCWPFKFCQSVAQYFEYCRCTFIGNLSGFTLFFKHEMFSVPFMANFTHFSEFRLHEGVLLNVCAILRLET